MFLQVEQVLNIRKQTQDASTHKCSLLSLATQGIIKLIRGTKVIKMF